MTQIIDINAVMYFVPPTTYYRQMAFPNPWQAVCAEDVVQAQVSTTSIIRTHAMIAKALITLQAQLGLDQEWPSTHDMV